MYKGSRDSLSSSVPTWRTFRFFDNWPIQEETYKDAIQSACCVTYAPVHAGAWASPRGALVIALPHGQVRVVDARTYVELLEWRAFEETCDSVHVAAECGAVVTVGRDVDKTSPIVRVWRIESSHDANTSRAALCMSAIIHTSFQQAMYTPDALEHEAPRPHITSVAVSPNLSHIAVGLGDGSVLVLRGASEHMHPREPATLRFKTVRDATMVEDGHAPDEVSCLVLCHDAPGTTVLLIATVTCTFKCTIEGAGAGNAPTVVDTIGCAKNCGVQFDACSPDTWDGAPAVLSSKLVLARNEALYMIGTGGREASIALEGKKKSVHALHGELLIVFAGGDSLQRVVVFDLDTKCITYTGDFERVSHVWTNNGDENFDAAVHIDTTTPTKLMSKSLSAKLEQLFRLHLYIQAIPFVYARAARFPHRQLPGLASSSVIGTMRFRTHSVSPVDVLVAEVYRRYGEYLYARGDFEGAMQQFCHTIGVISPSMVIRKFLDAQRLQFLTVYLEALHARHLANADHATLLLNCYTKLRDTNALDRFLRAPDVPLDVQVAMDVCRRAGCIEQAAYLAQTHGIHDIYLNIQLRDKLDPKAALAYLETLAPSDVMDYFPPCARLLLEAEPEATADLLVRVYADSSGSKVTLLPSMLSHFVGHERTLERFLERIRTTKRDRHELVLVHDTLIELYLKHAPDKALAILESHDDVTPYTPSSALVLCQDASYTPGLLCLYERLGMVDAIYEHWVHAHEAGDAEAPRQLLQMLEKFGTSETHLYVSTLAFFTSSPDLLEAHITDVERMLAYIETHALLSPSEVVQLLGRNSVAPMSLLTPYLMKHVHNERTELLSAQKLVASYREEAQTKQAEIAALQSLDEPRVFQHHECGLCNQPLELPAVHFMCRHSFHLRCLPEGEAARECPICADEHKTVRALRDPSMLSSLDMVLEEVHAAEDGFDVIADMFSKGLTLFS